MKSQEPRKSLESQEPQKSQESHRPRKVSRILAIVLLVLMILAVGMGIYFHIYYHADEEALSALRGSSSVKVTENNGDYFFDGPGTESAVIFYPGAKVESTAYAPLMLQIAESGTDCILADMPLRFALLDINAADRIRKEYDYQNWYLAGHSLGGAAASMNLLSHGKKGSMPYRGMIFLASYPSKSMKDIKIPVLSVYGTNDLDPEAIEKHEAYLPEDAKIVQIRGGNHAQFGNYGLQKGDGTATVSAQKQQEQTVQAIREWMDS